MSLFDLWKALPAGPKRKAKRWWFELLSAVDSGDDFLLMNHGYAHLDRRANERAWAPEDARQRYQIQLYDRLAAAVEWSGRDALEVSCGRGGGTAYVARTFAPRSLVGVDITARAIRFCQRRYDIPGLTFQRGDAEALPFPDACFDVVLSVEASVTYANPPRFFAEVARVLRPGGELVFADYRKRWKLDAMRSQLRDAGLALLKEEDITPNVVAARELDDARKRALVDVYLPRWLRRSFLQFAGAGGGVDDDRRRFARGDKVYLACIFRKP